MTNKELESYDRQSLALYLYNTIRGELIQKSYPGYIPDRLWDDEGKMRDIIEHRMCGDPDYGEEDVQILRRYYLETEEEKREEEEWEKELCRKAEEEERRKGGEFLPLP